MGRAGFMAMAAMFRVRDLIRPPLLKLEEMRVKSGDTVLDFGCGPGGYTLEAARIVGDRGRVYGLDVEPYATRRVAAAAARRGMDNIEVIVSGCETGLDSACVDVILLYDVFHDIEDADCVLDELRRVIKPQGILSVSDHHLEKDEIIAAVTSGERFALAWEGKGTINLRATS